MKGEHLYKLGVSVPLLKCISQEEEIDLLKEVHSGYCGSHTRVRTLVGKVLGKDSIGQWQSEMLSKL